MTHRGVDAASPTPAEGAPDAASPAGLEPPRPPVLAVDYTQVLRVARVLRGVLQGYTPEPFTDPRFYPPEGSDPELTAAYFLAMVAVDHRTSRPGRPYEGIVDGVRFHGADLLYALAARRLREDPGFFEARSLARVSDEEVDKLFTSDDGARLPDASLRAALLRDVGRVLIERFEGSALRLLEESGGYLRRGDARRGLLDLLRYFIAYNDPVEKKSHLLVKFLERRGLFRARDSWHKNVPVDNHVVRLALRTGIVRVVDGVEVFTGGFEVSDEVDVYIRMVVRRAWRLVADAARLDPYILDDLLWSAGRKCCTRESPQCTGCSSACEKLGFCRGGVCVLNAVCPRAPRRYTEHTFTKTWWY